MLAACINFQLGHLLTAHRIAGNHAFNSFLDNSFRKTAGQACSGARELMGQYLLVIVVFLPLCGAATGVAYLSGKIL